MGAQTIDTEPGDSILRLPDELLQGICFYLSPPDAIHFGLTNQRLYRLVDQPLLWRHFCETYFEHWHLTDETDPGIAKHIAAAPWKKHFYDRVERDKRNKELFESALSTQHERYSKIQQIANHGYEARSMLQVHSNAPDECEDVLARRYYAEATLGLIHRTNALKIWSSLADDPSPSLEKYIAAFDLFIIGKEWGDIRDITTTLDSAAFDIKIDHPNLMELDIEERSLIVVRWLREHGLVGLNQVIEYHNMKHNFMSFNLRNRSQASLPLQSAVVFSAVAQRLGIDAHPVNYPTHIFVVVQLPAPTASSTSTSPEDPNHRLYLDPWSTQNESRLGDIISYDTLARRLTMSGIPPRVHPTYLDPAPVRAMVSRTCRNIMRSYEEWNRGGTRDDLVGNHHAFYAYLWAMALVEESGPRPADEVGPWDRPHLGHLPAFFRDHFPEDLELVSRYLGPLFARHPRVQQFMHILQEMKAEDVNRRPVVRRGPHTGSVKYKVGQMFQHKRYGYTGVIRSWDSGCQAGEGWISQMRVDDLDRGRGQAFYHVMGEDRSSRYVAEENIEPIYTDPSEKVLGMAGRYFKRWDADKRVFVSNVRDEYPDD
ncbi:putative DNA binding protein 7 [Elsinoe australis]|uniref:Putative DNA binding protein 7 n=1 Tax=Elsinoe australis TaxID=40998 RepID=A0A4U7B066_9PEZI|nr:putative DNA binding protein 7 [Elsinoe australis]